MTGNFPITDEHMHIDLRSKGLGAVKEFQQAGGTHIFLVMKPSWTLGIKVTKPEDQKAVFEETIEISRQINETGVTSFPVLGVHPAEITHLLEYMDLQTAVKTMKGGLDIAAEYVQKGLAVGLKSGRPHYPVTQEVWEASNEIMAHAFTLAKDITARAKRTGIKHHKVVKHYAPPLVTVCERLGIFPGVLAGKGAIEEALTQGTRFMMETDYIDDPQRPGAVLGPKTIPKRTLKLAEEHGEEPFWKIHKENPELVYDVDIEI
jgi:TatD-related deoxyribonuclease